MPNAANTQFKEVDETLSITPLDKGINAVFGPTKRGPFANPERVISNWEDFENLFGGEIATSQFPTLCKRALERGSSLRVCRIANAPVKATMTAVEGFPEDSAEAYLFAVTAKHAGADYNNLKFQFTLASNGNSSYFDLRIYHATDTTLKAEEYRNLTFNMTGPNFQEKINQESELVVISGFDYNTENAEPAAPAAIYSFSGGSDGGGITAADYVGSSSTGTGIYAFNPYDDMMHLASLFEIASADHRTINAAAIAYVQGRQDMVYLAHIPNTFKTAVNIAAEKVAQLVDSSYVGWFGGGAKLLGNKFFSEVSEMGDVLGMAAYSDRNYGEWYSFAGPNRGVAFNIGGVVNNFGAVGQYADLNYLANRQINMLTVKNNKVQLSGNFTGQLATSKLSYLSIRKLLIFIKKSMRPLLEQFMEDPLDLKLIRQIYNVNKTFLDGLQSQEKRALFKYNWQGDQNAASLNQLVVNTAQNIGLGKYKVKLDVTPINSLQEIEITINISSAGVEISDNFESLV